MAIVTFLSDFGESDHYVAAVKAKILSINSTIPIVDITHQVQCGDIAHAAFVLRSVYRDFPPGTIHLIAVNATGRSDSKCIAIELRGHFFIGNDTGIFGLLSKEDARHVVDINALKPKSTTFPTRNILAVAAARLASGTAITDLGPRLDTYNRMLPRQLKATTEVIAGHVIRVDHYGNLITNIDKETFAVLSVQRNFTIRFGRERIHRVHEHVYQVEPGEVFVLFNDLGLMEIGINTGNANKLLGLDFDSAVMIKLEKI
jgi:S-adenosylmethionine hydrolase